MLSRRHDRRLHRNHIVQIEWVDTHACEFAQETECWEVDRSPNPRATLSKLENNRINAK